MVEVGRVRKVCHYGVPFFLAIKKEKGLFYFVFNKNFEMSKDSIVI